MCGKNMTNVYEEIDMSALPTEYLPDDYKGPSAGPMNQIIGTKWYVRIGQVTGNCSRSQIFSIFC